FRFLNVFACRGNYQILAISLVNKDVFLGARFECHDCGRSYKHKSHLRYHIRQDHADSGIGQVVCHVCNKIFKNRNSWRVHFYNICREGSGVSECTLCGAKFERKYALRRHLIKAHSKKTPTLS
ncbi:unnamed protein product, partial [Tenebrio molitor]